MRGIQTLIFMLVINPIVLVFYQNCAVQGHNAFQSQTASVKQQKIDPSSRLPQSVLKSEIQPIPILEKTVEIK